MMKGWRGQALVQRYINITVVWPSLDLSKAPDSILYQATRSDIRIRRRLDVHGLLQRSQATVGLYTAHWD